MEGWSSSIGWAMLFFPLLLSVNGGQTIKLVALSTRLDAWI
jgi:hypothetical protein